MVKWTLSAVGVLLAAGIGVAAYLVGGPGNLYGMLRYGLPQAQRGNLRVGDQALDVELLALDGTARFHLQERIGSRPLILIFGSYT